LSADSRALAFSAGGDGGRRSPEVPDVLRYALWVAAYWVLILLLAIFVESFANWLVG
jgi:hypothetical protein